ncbi:predicted protein [Sclerotinia sclerotiorum 1980 UF-70]|uniref:Uncharacterized protein n=1 Tax=Sclerotinia sclerotiorum (strain ATCC 18683 / 1980 / Ss-1) TaxID=665079 RepID=A7EQH2_SCLS1|nr:predicted protein [Sclerotinia sclerotiorum 1980 UF-70]EDN91714.1 predicted protein [Sclerotinia sclerotiorum 1980 UF-70]
MSLYEKPQVVFEFVEVKIGSKLYYAIYIHRSIAE